MRTARLLQFSLYLPVLCLFSCGYEKCNCDVNEGLIDQGDSIVQKENIAGRYWQPMGETDLRQFTTETYRLFIDPPFADEPTELYTLQILGDSAQLTRRRLVFDNEHRYYVTLQEHSETLSQAQLLSFKNVLEEKCFWTMPHELEAVLDGKSRIFEGYNPNGNECTTRDFHTVLSTSGRHSELMAISDAIEDLSRTE
jgi:hypothetical protein